MTPIRLFAPDTYPRGQKELRAYTIAAFRVAQASEQLSLGPMQKDILEFLVKGRAIGYWKTNGWLQRIGSTYHLTAAGLVHCQAAINDQLSHYNTTPSHVGYWESQFRQNENLPRHGTFASPCEAGVFRLSNAADLLPISLQPLLALA